MNLQENRTEQFLKYVEQKAYQSLMDEVSATPKPGLVDLKDSGAHTDMDYHTFLGSAKAITPFLADMARAGTLFKMQEEIEKEQLFLSIRPIGLKAEQAMFAATNGVNTHKGMIFSMGIVAAAAGLACSEYFEGAQSKKTPDADYILNLCRNMCRRPLEADFASISPLHPKTHGERLFIEHGIRGIRGEAADGFPSIKNASLPIFRRELLVNSKENWNLICLQVLLKLMSCVDDTNVLFRTGMKELSYVKESSQKILSLGGSFTAQGILALEQLNEDFIKKNISPGGCADLLAITLFLWRIEQYFLPGQSGKSPSLWSADRNW